MAAAQRRKVGRGPPYVPLQRSTDHRDREGSRSRREHPAGSRARKPARGAATMNHLRRELAPVSDAAWSQVDAEAARTLKHFLTARRLVDFVGPEGWAEGAVPRGRVEDVTQAPAGIQARIRTVQPLVEYRAEFWLERAELEAIERGARDADVDPARDAARRIAIAEDQAGFVGNRAALITAITEGTPNAKRP